MYAYITIIKKTGIFFDLTLLVMLFPYPGKSVDPVTHMQGPLGYVLLEKNFLILIR